ncbi:hypothetical protein CR970_03415 [Candidatus Saccharibacteria bacterium]|nr:MAG: hypothetical protein CR970_03415 [Candidatus Saccharibacteria bacterium]
MYKSFLRRLFGRSQKRLVRYGLLALHVGLLAGVFVFVTTTRGATQSAAQSAALIAENEAPTNALDQISAADIAVHVARMTDLPETDSVQNHADSFSVQLTAAAPASETIVAKPQIVADAAIGKSNKDIQAYVVVAGDTVSSIATKFGVTSDSIRWSNGLPSGDRVTVGKELSIPPITGVVYEVKVGDTAESLAKQFEADQAKIVAFNDAEVKGLTVGEKIVIPDGVIKARPTSRTTTTTSSGGSFSWTSNYVPIYGGNRYAYGWCTWYAASRVPVPSNWGNANTWDDGARAAGWTVSSVPVVGAVAQADYGSSYLGHVGIVEAVSEDGTMIKYSDMNGLSGWGRVGYSDWVPVHSAFSKFLYR